MNDKLKTLASAMIDLKYTIKLYLVLGDVSTQLCQYLLKLVDIIDTLIAGEDPILEIKDLSYRIIDIVARSILERIKQILETTSNTDLVVAQGQLQGCLGLIKDGHTQDAAFNAIASSIEHSLKTIGVITKVKYPDVSIMRP